MKNNICINTSNLHYGGGVQVATSFLSELTKLDTGNSDDVVTVFVSSRVAENLSFKMNKLKEKFNVKIFDVFGLEAFSPRVRREFKGFDLVFSVFGPDYLYGIRAKRIVGFAQAWILYNDNEAYNRMSTLSAVKLRIMFWAKKQLFKGADAYIVELEHVKQGMMRKKLGNQGNIFIAYNTISSDYLNIDEFKLSRKISCNETFRIGIISRNYPHKNFSIFPEIKIILEQTYNKKIEWFVTFSDEEFKKESVFFQSEVINIGPKRVDECIDTYLKFDAVVFPSLLECFSVTPLEAMATGRALFASDRPFNRDVCGEHAYYFDPLSPEDAARVINDYIENKWGRDLEERLAAREHAINFSNPRDRALKYIEVINKVLS